MHRHHELLPLPSDGRGPGGGLRFSHTYGFGSREAQNPPWARSQRGLTSLLTAPDLKTVFEDYSFPQSCLETRRFFAPHTCGPLVSNGFRKLHSGSPCWCSQDLQRGSQTL